MILFAYLCMRIATHRRLLIVDKNYTWTAEIASEVGFKRAAWSALKNEDRSLQYIAAKQEIYFVHGYSKTLSKMYLVMLSEKKIVYKLHKS